MLRMDQSIIGIDFGSSFSRVSVFRNGRVEILENEQGNKSTPSYVAFTDKYPLVGDTAKNQGGINAKNTIHSVKRYLGRPNQEVVRHQMYKQFRFCYIEDGVRVQSRGSQLIKNIEEVTAIHLAKLKNMAEKFLQTSVEYAVITVPAQFSSTQRRAVCDAAQIAELVPILVNESVAAALAYLFEFRRELCSGTKNLLIFDFGGGRVDAAVVTATNGTLTVRASEGTMSIGGDDLDAVLIEEFACEYHQKNRQDIKACSSAFHRLREACERIKKQLSFSTNASFTIEDLHGYKDFSSSMKRNRFEYLCQSLLALALECVSKVMEQSSLRKQDIDEIILVGGSSRIPKVQELLSRYFNGKPVNKAINPDEAVVIGAAVYSALFRNPNPLQEIYSKWIEPHNKDFSVAFEMDKNETLTVTFTDLVINTKLYSVKLYSIGRTPYSREQLNDMKSNIRQYRRDEEEEFARVEAKYFLESFLHQKLGKLDQLNISATAKQKIQNKCEQAEKWVNSAGPATSKMYKDKMNELMQYCETIQNGKKTSASSACFKLTSNRSTLKRTTAVENTKTCKPVKV